MRSSTSVRDPEEMRFAVKPNKLYEVSPTISYAGENLSRRLFERELGRNILEFDE